MPESDIIVEPGREPGTYAVCTKQRVEVIDIRRSVNVSLLIATVYGDTPEQAEATARIFANALNGGHNLQVVPLSANLRSEEPAPPVLQSPPQSPPGTVQKLLNPAGVKPKVPLMTCQGCGVRPGSIHKLGCSQEKCPQCQGVLIDCACIYKRHGLDPNTMEEKYPEIAEWPTEDMKMLWNREWGDKRIAYDGIRPHAAEAIEFGWYVRDVPDVGPVRCGAGERGAYPDTNRVLTDAIFDEKLGRYVLPARE